MAPVTHLPDDYVAVDPLDEDATEHERAVTREEQFTPEQARVLSAIDESERKLAEAVASRDPDAVTLAMERLENVRQDALRAESRARDLRKAETAARKAESDAKRAAHLATADKIEARLRKHGPTVCFPASRGRVVVVKLAGTDLEPSYATEACRRIAYALTQAAASQIIGSRAAGRIVRMPEWLDGLLNDESGLARYLKSGIVTIEEEN